jgi:hypothetical protein
MTVKAKDLIVRTRMLKKKAIKKYFNDVELATALRNAGGSKIKAARDLGCSTSVFYYRIERSEFLQKIVELIDLDRADLCEHIIDSAVKKGNWRPAAWSLERLNKEKYSKKVIADTGDHGDLTINVLVANELGRVTKQTVIDGAGERYYEIDEDGRRKVGPPVIIDNS